jgi:carbamoyl-phosphate synthase large subunit
MRRNAINILFTCIGRRVALLESFRKAGGAKVRTHGTDTTSLSPALQLCDRKFIVKPVTSSGYIKQILDVVGGNKIDLLIPTVDLDLKLLAANRERFAKMGCRVLISPPKVVDLCQDKRKTYRFLLRNNFDTPETMSLRTAMGKRRLAWPCFLKPCDGYASRGSAVVTSRRELLFFGPRIPNCIVQEYVDGTEYTCDVYVDFRGKVRCVVPRNRIEVRAGEVSKARIEKDPIIINEAARLVETLGAGPGVITLQLFKTAVKGSRRPAVKFIEINPRFGGGVILSIKAGADFPKWILQELSAPTDRARGGKARTPWRDPKAGRFTAYKDRLTMLRYDDEVWV